MPYLLSHELELRRANLAGCAPPTRSIDAYRARPDILAPIDDCLGVILFALGVICVFGKRHRMKTLLGSTHVDADHERRHESSPLSLCGPVDSDEGQ